MSMIEAAKTAAMAHYYAPAFKRYERQRELAAAYKPTNKALINASAKIKKEADTASKAAADIDRQIEAAKADVQRIEDVIKNNRVNVDAEKAAVLKDELRAATDKVDYLEMQRNQFIVNSSMSLQDFEVIMHTIMRETENDLEKIKREYMSHVEAIAKLADQNLAAIGYANDLLNMLQDINDAYKPIVNNYNGKHKDCAFNRLHFNDRTCIYSASDQLNIASRKVKEDLNAKRK